ncbi:MAG: type II secretion system protein GspJ [Candidatus Omnitrophota bacterium]|jgi:hypothetical protein
MKREQGYLLVELLIAGVLFSFLAGSIGAVFVNTVQGIARVRETIQEKNNTLFFFSRIRKDLRRSAQLSEFPFEGKPRMCRIPVKTIDSKKNVRLCYIKYTYENGRVYREELPLAEDSFAAAESPKQVVLKDIESFRFLYPYLSGEEKIEFREDWRKDTYYGLPAAVEMKIVLKNSVEKQPVLGIIEIPQGSIAPVPEGATPL